MIIRLIITLSIICTAVVLLNKFERYSGPSWKWDILILTQIAKLQTPLLNYFFYGISLMGSISVLAPLTIMVVLNLTQNGQSADAYMMVLNLFGAFLIANVAKYRYKRKRPELFPSYGERPQDHSFPSAHSAQIVAFILSVTQIFNSQDVSTFAKTTASALLIVVLIAYSRIYLQVHYPSDVMAGLAVGVIWCLCTGQLFISIGNPVK